MNSALPGRVRPRLACRARTRIGCLSSRLRTEGGGWWGTVVSTRNCTTRTATFTGAALAPAPALTSAATTAGALRLELTAATPLVARLTGTRGAARAATPAARRDLARRRRKSRRRRRRRCRLASRRRRQIGRRRRRRRCRLASRRARPATTAQLPTTARARSAASPALTSTRTRTWTTRTSTAPIISGSGPAQRATADLGTRTTMSATR